MLGAIAGDIIGSVYEWKNIKTKFFPLFQTESRFTDDSVLTIATADAILNNGDYGALYKDYYLRYPKAGYGGMFSKWAESRKSEPYQSWGNGSAMRVSPVGFAFHDLDTVLQEARRSAVVTHSHPEGVKGAQATATAIFLARTEKHKDTLKSYIQTTFGYNLELTLDEIRPTYQFDVSCQGTVPPAIIAFLESTDFEDAIRNAVSLGGDTDTLTCITGAIAEAFYGGVPQAIAEQALLKLNPHLRSVTAAFMEKFVK